MTTALQRPALCDIDARRELRRQAAPALALLALGLLMVTFAATIDGVAHARATRFESHAYEIDAYVTAGYDGSFALFDRPPFIVPVVLNDPSTGWASQHTTVWVSRSDPRDVRIASETRAFIGSLYPVQEGAATIGVVLLLAAAEFAFVWWRQRRILAAHAWRWIAIAPSPHARECLGEPRGVRYRSRRLRLTSGGILQIAGPREPAQTAWSIVRREACNRMYVVRGPLTAREPGPALRTVEHT